MSTPQFAQIPLAQIVASLTNPRKSFNEAKLAELAESIQASGVHQPVLVRPLPGSRVADTGKKVQYEIVAGERRFRACKMAGLASIPAMISQLADAQVLEIQLIENLQRDDLSALEEAQGYQLLNTALGSRAALSVDEIAKRIGKSRRYVYNRLQLLDTAPEVQAALAAGQIDASRALIIGTIRRMSDQVKALETAVDPDYGGDVLSVRDLTAHIRRRFFLKIADIRWSESQEGLAGQGACSTCTKRSDQETELDLFNQTDGPALCLDADCYAAKEAAHTKALTDEWADRGASFKTRDQALEEELLRWHGDGEGRNIIRAGQVREDLPEPHTGKTIKQLLGKEAKNIQAYAIEATQPGQPAALYYDRAQTLAALKAKGIDLHGSGDDDDDGDEGESHETWADARDRARESRLRTEHALMSALQSKSFMLADIANKSVLRWLAANVLEYTGEDIAEAFQFETDADPIEALMEQADKSPDACIKIIAADCIQNALLDSTDTVANAAAASFLSAVGISRADIEAKVQADLQAEREAKAAPALPPPPPAALRANNAVEQAPSPITPPPKPAAPKPRSRAKKLGTKEAEQGIAAAMQSIDEAASASAVAPPAPASVKLAIDDRVQVLPTYSQAKRHGKQGQIRSASTVGVWWVNFGGRAGTDLIPEEYLQKVPA